MIVRRRLTLCSSYHHTSPLKGLYLFYATLGALAQLKTVRVLVSVNILCPVQAAFFVTKETVLDTFTRFTKRECCAFSSNRLSLSPQL